MGWRLIQRIGETAKNELLPEFRTPTEATRCSPLICEEKGIKAFETQAVRA
jgi:hypothetical protein